MNERRENMGEREELRIRRKRVAAEVESHRNSLRAALPLTAEPHHLDGEHITTLAIALHERLKELQGLDKKIGILTSQLEG